MGDGDSSRRFFEKSLSVELGGRLSENHFFQALARLELGLSAAAKIEFNGLIAAGEGQLQTQSNRDFFAKFGERLNLKNRLARAHYLIGLGRSGLGNKALAGAAFRKALTYRPDHLWSSHFLDELKKE